MCTLYCSYQASDWSSECHLVHNWPGMTYKQSTKTDKVTRFKVINTAVTPAAVSEHRDTVFVARLTVLPTAPPPARPPLGVSSVKFS